MSLKIKQGPHQTQVVSSRCENRVAKDTQKIRREMMMRASGKENTGMIPEVSFSNPNSQYTSTWEKIIFRGSHILGHLQFKNSYSLSMLSLRSWSRWKDGDRVPGNTRLKVVGYTLERLKSWTGKLLGMLSFLFPQKGFGRCVNIGLCLCEHLPPGGKGWARSTNMFQNYTTS